jgi:hypothetical protein
MPPPGLAPGAPLAQSCPVTSASERKGSPVRRRPGSPPTARPATPTSRLPTSSSWPPATTTNEHISLPVTPTLRPPPPTPSASTSKIAKQTAPTLTEAVTEALTSPVRTPTKRTPWRHVKLGSDINDLPAPPAGPPAGPTNSAGSPSKRHGAQRRRSSEPSTGELPRHRTTFPTPPTHCKLRRNEKLQLAMDERDFDAPPGKPSTAARGRVFDAEHCAVADDPLAAGTAHRYSVNITVDINQRVAGSSRHQTAPNNAALSRMLQDTRALAPDVDARARQERGRGALLSAKSQPTVLRSESTKSEHTVLRSESCDPPCSPSAARRQKEAVRRLRNLYCQRTDGFEVLGARYKAVWGSTLGAVATVHEGSLGIDRGLARHVCAPLSAVREGEEAAEQVCVYPDGYRGAVLTDLQSSI